MTNIQQQQQQQQQQKTTHRKQSDLKQVGQVWQRVKIYACITYIILCRVCKHDFCSAGKFITYSFISIESSNRPHFNRLTICFQNVCKLLKCQREMFTQALEFVNCFFKVTTNVPKISQMQQQFATINTPFGDKKENEIEMTLQSHFHFHCFGLTVLFFVFLFFASIHC